MRAFNTQTGLAAAILAPNVDTDVIMPKQFLTGIDRSGLDRGVFHDLRFDSSGKPRRDFVLSEGVKADAKFLIVGPNFGCGSSREHAVWGLIQFGIRAIIGTSFAGIFTDNCLRNGLLLISLKQERIEELAGLGKVDCADELTLSLPAQEIRYPHSKTIPFEIDAAHKEVLVQGLDAITQTFEHRDEIAAFEGAQEAEQPWLHRRYAPA